MIMIPELIRELPALVSIPLSLLISICAIVAAGYLIRKLPKILTNNNAAIEKQNNLLQAINMNMANQKKSLDNNTEVIRTFTSSQKLWEEQLRHVSNNTQYLRENMATKDDISMMLHLHER